MSIQYLLSIAMLIRSKCLWQPCINTVIVFMVIIDYDDGKFCVMNIGRGNRSTRESLPQRHFVHHKSHLTRPGIEPESPLWEASDWSLELWRGLNTCSFSFKHTCISWRDLRYNNVLVIEIVNVQRFLLNINRHKKSNNNNMGNINS
jgi:hypothetical protein